MYLYLSSRSTSIPISISIYLSIIYLTILPSQERMLSKFCSLGSGCYNRMAYIQQKLTAHSSGGWASETRKPVQWGSGEDPPAGCRLLISCILTWWREGKRALWGPFYKALTPATGLRPPDPITSQIPPS